MPVPAFAGKGRNQNGSFMPGGNCMPAVAAPILFLDSASILLTDVYKRQHFSSAFVVLMRAAGIPARVVTGYAGGYRNKYGNYWICLLYTSRCV